MYSRGCIHTLARLGRGLAGPGCDITGLNLSLAGRRTFLNGDFIRSLTTVNKESKIGIIGCGDVGQAVCHNLTRKGWKVAAACDINPKQLARLPAGVPHLTTPKEVVQASEVIFTCLPKPPAVKAVAEGPDGILESIIPGQIWVDHSTTEMEQTQEYAKVVQEAGAHMLESPITGGMDALKKGQMIVFIGGKQTVAEAIRPILDASFIKVLYVGPTIGTAMVIKVISNMLCCVNVVAMGEALMLGKRANIDLRTFWEAIRMSVGNSFVWETAAPLVFNGTDYDPGFSLTLQNKDLQLGYDMARKFKTPMDLHNLTLSIYRRAEYQFGERAGCYIVPKALEIALGESLQVPGFENWEFGNVVEEGSLIVKHEGIET